MQFLKRFDCGHIFMLTGAVALATAGILLGQSAMAAGAGDLPLRGTVTTMVDIAVAPTAGYNALALTNPTTVTQQKVADVTEATNNPAGYSVAVASTNRGASHCAGTSPCLWNAAGATAVAFTLFKNGTSLNFAAGNSVNWSNVASINIAGTTNDARISYAVVTLLAAGNFDETLTFTITAL